MSSSLSCWRDADKIKLSFNAYASVKNERRSYKTKNTTYENHSILILLDLQSSSSEDAWCFLVWETEHFCACSRSESVTHSKSLRATRTSDSKRHESFSFIDSFILISYRLVNSFYLLIDASSMTSQTMSSTVHSTRFFKLLTVYREKVVSATSRDMHARSRRRVDERKTTRRAHCTISTRLLEKMLR